MNCKRLVKRTDQMKKKKNAILCLPVTKNSLLKQSKKGKKTTKDDYRHGQ